MNIATTISDQGGLFLLLCQFASNNRQRCRYKKISIGGINFSLFNYVFVRIASLQFSVKFNFFKLKYRYFGLHKIVETYKANSIATLLANMNCERDRVRIHPACIMNHECSTLFTGGGITIVN